MIKLFRLLLLLCAITMIFVLPAMAAEIVASGDCGANITWTLDVNGLLTISGEGSIRGYETPPQAISEAPYRAYANQINALLIEDGIEHIGSFTFFALPLDSVSIADSVLSIGQYAFSSTPITEIELPDHLTSIGFETFSQCENLEEITIPSTVVSIQSNAFDACSSLKKATFLGDAPQYFGNAFANTTEDFTIYYYEGTSGWTTPTWTAPDGTVYNTVELPRKESSALLGDINLDGSVDIRDAEMLFLHSMLPNLYPISYKDNTDFTGDGSLDIRDAQLLFQYSMLPDVYPIH